MTAETITLESTVDELAVLDAALQHLDETPALKAIRQKLRQVTTPETSDPLEQVRHAVDAVTEADQNVTRQIEKGRQAILAALDAGYTQQTVADYIGRSQPRVAQMLKAN